MQVVFATSEPFDTRWMADLGHVLRKDIQRVVANPLDVGRYLGAKVYATASPDGSGCSGHAFLQCVR